MYRYKINTIVRILHYFNLFLSKEYWL